MKKLALGIRKDERPGDRPNGSWSNARNIVVSKQFKSVSNEDGVLDITPIASSGYNDFPVNKIVIGQIPTNIEIIYFFGSTSPFESEIGIVESNGKYRTIIKDSSTVAILNFNVNYPVKGTFEYKYNSELIIGFTDYYNYPRVLNTSCIPFTLLPDKTVALADKEKARNLLQQFPNMKTPLILADTDLRVFDGLGSLKSGVYYPTTAYELADGTSTFYIKIYNGVPIYTDSTSLSFEKVGGAEGGIPTNKAIEIKFSDIDLNFKYLKVGYIYQENGVTSAWFVKNVGIEGNTELTVTITGAEESLEELVLDEVLVPNAVYTKAKGITNLQGRLYEGNLEQEEDINLQPVANEVVVKWVREKDISINARVLNTVTGGAIVSYGSFKDPSLVFFDKSFKAGECMAFYLVGKAKTGLYTQAFHIPGRIVTSGDRTSINGTPEIDAIGGSVKKFQLQDTSSAGGIMGAWENQNEEYPLDSTGTAIHPDYTNIPGISLGNRKVRHHVFPDLRTLKGYGENFQKPINNVTCSYNFTAPDNVNFGNPDRENLYAWYVAGDPGLSCFTVGVNGNNTIWQSFSRVGLYTMTFDFTNIHGMNDCLGMTNANPANDCVAHVFAEWQIYFNGVQVASYYADLVNGGAITDNFPATTQTFNFTVSPGDVIEVFYHPYVTTNNNTCGNDFQIADNLPCFNTDLVSKFSARDVDSEVIGIEISNLNIPADIADKLDSWEIYYAKRTTNNIRVLAQDMIKDGRFHNFDLMSTQTISQAKYLKPQLKYTGTVLGGQLKDTVNTPNIEAAFPVEEFKVINLFQYCGENTSIPQNNANRAGNIFIAAGVGNTTSNHIQSVYGDTNTLVDICIYRQDMYATYDTQQLVATGYAFKITASGLQPAKKVFGGDIFVNQFGFRLYLTNTDNYLLCCESASNIGLRFDEVSLTKQYFPKFNIATPSYYGYNRDNNVLNEFNSLITNGINGDCNTGKITTFHTRVIFSIVDPNEGRYINWRVFKVNDYYEMPKNKGVIWSLLGVDRELYIHHEHSLFIAGIKDSIGTGDGEAFLKSSELFDRPPREILPVTEGYAGNQSHFSTIFCPLGYCFIDRNARKVFVYNGELKEVSLEGVYNYFKKFGQSLLVDVDNPYIGNGYMMAYDHEFKRLLITKKDSEYEFTMSFSNGQWICNHDYFPHSLVSTRMGLFAIDNNQNKLFKHNNPLVKAIYYDGQIKDSYVDVPFNDVADLSKTLQSINWLTDVVKADGTVLRDETITHLMIFNNYQCSGLIDLREDNDLWFGKDARDVEETWNYDRFRDLVNDKTLPIFDNKDELIASNINYNKSWFEKSRFISKFVIVRFITNNVSQNDLHIVGVNAKMIKSDRQ